MRIAQEDGGCSLTLARSAVYDCNIRSTSKVGFWYSLCFFLQAGGPRVRTALRLTTMSVKGTGGNVYVYVAQKNLHRH